MKREEKIMLYSMLVKLSKDCKQYGESNYSYGWDEHQEERNYFEELLEELIGDENESES